MKQIFFTTILALLTISSLNAGDNVDNQQQKDLDSFRALKEQVISNEEMFLTNRRNNQISSRNTITDTQTACASLTTAEEHRRMLQLQRRNRLLRGF